MNHFKLVKRNDDSQSMLLGSSGHDESLNHRRETYQNKRERFLKKKIFDMGNSSHKQEI